MGWLYILVGHHQTRKQVGHKVSRRVTRRTGVSLKMLKSIFVVRGLKRREEQHYGCYHWYRVVCQQY